MREELENKLYEKYPKLFAQRNLPDTISLMSYGIGVGDGWYNIMNVLCWTIQNHVDYQQRKNPEYKQVEFFQIKEKFGGLRVYTSGADEVVNNLIVFAENMAIVTCEQCGNPGKIRYTSWNTCRCDECQKKYCDQRGIKDEKEDEQDD
jgi:hypothetical protein